MDINKATGAYEVLCCFMEVCDNYQKKEEDGDDGSFENNVNGVEDERIPKKIDCECGGRNVVDLDADDGEMDVDGVVRDYHAFNAR